MGHTDGDPSVAHGVVPVYTIELGDNARLVPEEIVVLDGICVATPTKEDEMTIIVSAQLAQVDVDGVNRRTLELPVERNPIAVSIVVHNGPRSWIYDEPRPRF